MVDNEINNNNEEFEEEIVSDESSVEDWTAKLKKIRKELNVCRSEKQEYLNLSQRLRADYVNLQKAMETKRLELVEFANQPLLLELLDLADSFDQAFANKEAWEAVAENWRKGVEYIYAKLLEIIKAHGLIPVDPLGSPFDPQSQESLALEEVDDESRDGVVLAVLKKGYLLRGKVLRPAQVKVGTFNKK